MIDNMKNYFEKVVRLSVLLFVCLTVGSIYANDWPEYMHDKGRSGIADQNITFPLYPEWRYTALQSPKPAWPEPAKTDYWHREADLLPRVIFDRAFHTITVNNNIYFGSSADDRIYCLNAETGQEKWSFFTGAPVRLSPAFFDGKIYTGSDDGYVYCLNADNGKLVWKFNGAEKSRHLPGNERIISIMPVRTGVLLDAGIAYFCAGLFPTEGVVLYALNADDGSLVWKQNIEVSPQGYLLASEDELYVPTGRTAPVVFEKKTGKWIGAFKGNGGTYATLDDQTLIYGGGDLGDLEIREPNSKDQSSSFKGQQIIATKDVLFLRTQSKISAIDRKNYNESYNKWKKLNRKHSDHAANLWDLREQRKIVTPDKIKDIDRKIDDTIDKIVAIDKEIKAVENTGILWERFFENTCSMILAGDYLVAGMQNNITVLDQRNGNDVWTGEVNGMPYSLNAAEGKLIISTDNGHIYSFSNENQKANIVKNSSQKPFGRNRTISNAAKHILDETKIQKGYCLILDGTSGQLGYELINNSDLNVLYLCKDDQQVENIRNNIIKSGLYGRRLHAIKASLEELPFSDYTINIVTNEAALEDGVLLTSCDEIFRVLRPFGGAAMVGVPKKQKGNLLKIIQSSVMDNNWVVSQNKKFVWAKMNRGELPGAGEWTHQYADPQNTSCSQDQLEGPMQIQWFGRPGPRDIINRHSRPMSPLFKDGRFYVTGNEVVKAIDPYNGIPLWEIKVPDSRVLGALKDQGHIVVRDDYLYIAVENECRAVAVENGNVEFVLKAPQLVTGEKRKWGYLSSVGNQLFGTGKMENASFTIQARLNCNDFEGDYREMVLGDYLFSMDRSTGDVLWTYKNGVVFHNTITIGDGDIYFVESRNPKAVNDPDGRLRIDTFCDSDTYIIRLNGKTGEKIWEKPFKFPYSQIMYMAFADNTVYVTGSYNSGKFMYYALYAFQSESGDKKWENSYRGGDSRWNNKTDKSNLGGEHGEQWQHPVILADKLILPPYDFDLQTGKRGQYYLNRGGGGCGGLSGSAHYLYARGSNPRMYSIHDGLETGTPLTKVNRPGCWINTIPAGGIVTLPESSSGCTCDYSIQTSFAFIPAKNN